MQIRQKISTLQSFLIALITLSLPSAVTAASFDCKKGSGKVERLVCRTSTLSQMDERLHFAYLEALATTDNPTNLRVDQRKWVSDVRNKCTDIGCLENAYAGRIDELSRASKRLTATCRIDKKQLKGAWQEEEDGDFEEFALGDETKKDLFISWRHHRPEMIGTWQLKACILTFKHVEDSSLQYTYHVLNFRNNILYLKDATNKELSSYKKIIRSLD